MCHKLSNLPLDTSTLYTLFTPLLLHTTAASISISISLDEHELLDEEKSTHISVCSTLFDSFLLMRSGPGPCSGNPVRALYDT